MQDRRPNRLFGSQDALLLAVTVLPVLAKAVAVGRDIAIITGSWFAFAAVIANDGAFMLAATAAGALSLHPRAPRALGVALRAGIILALAAYLVDALLLLNFATRLDVIDVLTYAKHVPTYLRDSFSPRRLLATLLAAAGVLPLVFLFLRERRAPGKAGVLAVAALFAAALAATQLAGRKSDFSHAYMYQSLLAHNLNLAKSARPYSKAFAGELLARAGADDGGLFPKAAPACPAAAPAAGGPNIILLVVESLSAYHSRLFSGIHDWTPRLDAMAAGNRAFPEFYANGFCTNDAMIALLTGELPLPAPEVSSVSPGLGRGGFEGFSTGVAGLPALLGGRGYATAYLTTGDTGFCNFADWGRAIGFGFIEGNEAAAYKDAPRLSLRAVPDEHLYRRVLAYIDSLGGARFFVTVMTTSSHFPYNVPGAEHSEEAAIRYTDEQIGRFYEQLRQRGFFGNGVLLILGDHHTMSPLTAAEVRRFGELAAPARIPLVVCGAGPQRQEDGAPHQQADIYQSIADLGCAVARAPAWRGDFLGTASRPPRFLFQKRSGASGFVSAFSASGGHVVEFDGDATRFAGQAPQDAAEARAILDIVNWSRLRHRQ